MLLLRAWSAPPQTEQPQPQPPGTAKEGSWQPAVRWTLLLKSTRLREGGGRASIDSEFSRLSLLLKPASTRFFGSERSQTRQTWSPSAPSDSGALNDRPGLSRSAVTFPVPRAHDVTCPLLGLPSLHHAGSAINVYHYVHRAVLSHSMLTQTAMHNNLRTYGRPLGAGRVLVRLTDCLRLPHRTVHSLCHAAELKRGHPR